MLTYWCIEHLHRLPDEVALPESAIRRAMLACATVRRRVEEDNA